MPLPWLSAIRQRLEADLEDAKEGVDDPEDYPDMVIPHHDLRRLLALVEAGERVAWAAEPLICQHDPLTMLGKPIGQYHCPECGQMQVAGVPHIADEEDLRMALTAYRAAQEGE